MIKRLAVSRYRYTFLKRNNKKTLAKTGAAKCNQFYFVPKIALER